MAFGRASARKSSRRNKRRTTIHDVALDTLVPHELMVRGSAAAPLEDPGGAAE